MVTTKSMNASIAYFDSEGKSHLEELVKVIKRRIRSREDLQGKKIVIFTADGRGPILAYSHLTEFSPKIIAVTFPRGFTVKGRNGSSFCPRIADDVLRFFNGVELSVITPPRLPFDPIDGMEIHNQQMRLVGQTIAIFGSGFALCLQAVMCACDAGLVDEGESVIAFSGDTAALFVASTTRHYMNPHSGISVQEIFCKPRHFTVSRHKFQTAKPLDAKTIEGEKTKV